MRRLVLGALVALLALGCERETRRFKQIPPGSDPTGIKRVSGLQAGPQTTDTAVISPYDANANGISEGQRLYEWMNCTGCHAQGGGAIGPPLMDDQWIYGSEPENIFSTIVEGRPNGMPSFRGRLTDDQVWKLVAYVRSLSGNVRKDAATGRQDHMHVKQRESAKETEPPLGQKGSGQ